MLREKTGVHPVIHWALFALVFILLLQVQACDSSKASPVTQVNPASTQPEEGSPAAPAPPADTNTWRILGFASSYKPDEKVDGDVFEMLRSKLVGLLSEKYEGVNKAASIVPIGEPGKVTDVSFDTFTRTLSWSYVNLGDYDFSRDVGVSDITPVALYFLANTSDGAGNDLLESWIDGDKSGEVGISDVTTIALNYLSQISGYKVMLASSPEGPFSEIDDVYFNGLPEPLGPGIRLSVGLSVSTFGYAGVVPFDVNGDTGEMSNLVEVGSRPDIIAVAPLTGQEGSQITLTPEIVGTQPFTLSWDFGSAASPSASSDAEPTITLIDVEGTYPCTLTASNPYGSDNFDFEIEVVQGPIIQPNAFLTANPTTGLLPLEVTFDASQSFDEDGQIVRYDWDWDSDGVFELKNQADPVAVHMYLRSGDYSATVRIYDDDGAIDEAVSIIHVNQAPSANLNAVPNFGETPLNATLDASGSRDSFGLIVLYEWDYEGDGTTITAAHLSPLRITCIALSAHTIRCCE